MTKGSIECFVWKGQFIDTTLLEINVLDAG